jgi:Passenger-associated-transport-repeat
MTHLNPFNFKLSLLTLAAFPSIAHAQFAVTSLSDSGAGSLRDAITQANAAATASTIIFNIPAGGTVALASMLPVLQNPNGISIDGANAGAGAITINGGSTSTTTGDRVFFVGVSTDVSSVSPGLTATTATNWAISNLTITGGNARGGDGGEGLGCGGGGGGAGLGGAIFVNAGNLALQSVSLLGNFAKGGNGGNGTDTSAGPSYGGANGGGGGGMGGFGGRGGGGGFGLGANPTNEPTPPASGAFQGAANNNAGPGQLGYPQSSSGGVGGFGGGGGGRWIYITNNEFGGGATRNGDGIGLPGGYGGGGGSGADAGFGGGGGGGIGGLAGSNYNGGFGGFGGSSGSVGRSGSYQQPPFFYSGGGGSGGAGAGLGGAVFVRKNATITLNNGNISGNSATGGVGERTFTPYTYGLGVGQGIFLAGSASYNVSAGNTVTINDTLGGGVDAQITGGFTKTGTGTLVLGGANSYTGATMVSAGTLAVNGATSALSPVTVLSGATLGGSGTVVGTATINGTINPGNSIGTLTVGGVSGSGTFTCETTAAATDKLISSGAVNLAGMAFTLSGMDLFAVGTSRVVLEKTSAGAISGNFTGLPQNALISRGGGQFLRVSYTGGDGNDMTLTAIENKPQITSFSMVPSSATSGSPINVNVNFQGLPNQAGLKLESSEDLITWTLFPNAASPQTWAADAAGMVNVQTQIPSASMSTAPKRFFRVVVPPTP